MRIQMLPLLTAALLGLTVGLASSAGSAPSGSPQVVAALPMPPCIPGLLGCKPRLKTPCIPGMIGCPKK